MKVSVYCVKDDYLGFQNPFLDMEDASACRGFELMLTKEVSIYSQHKDLFNLYKIGTFDTESGLIEPKVEFVQAGSVYDRKEKKHDKR